MFLYFNIIICTEKTCNDNILKNYLEVINDLQTTKRNIEYINQYIMFLQCKKMYESHVELLVANLNIPYNVNSDQPNPKIKNKGKKRKITASINETNSDYNNNCSSESLEENKHRKIIHTESHSSNQAIFNAKNDILCSYCAKSHGNNPVYHNIPNSLVYRNQSVKFTNNLQSNDNINNSFTLPIKITQTNQKDILRNICNNNYIDLVFVFDPEIANLNEVCINSILAFFCSKIPVLDNGLLIIKNEYKHLIDEYDEFYPFLYYLNYHRRDKNVDTYQIKTTMFYETIKYLKLYFSPTENSELRCIIHEILQYFVNYENIADVYFILCKRNFSNVYNQDLSIKPLKVLFFVFFFVNYEEVNPNFKLILKLKSRKPIKKILNKSYVLLTFFEHFKIFIDGIGLETEQKNSLIEMFPNMDSLRFGNESKIGLKNVKDTFAVTLQGVELVYKILEKFKKVIIDN